MKNERFKPRIRLKRILSLLLALSMVPALLPALSLSVYAAGSLTQINVDNGKSLNATWPYLVDGEPETNGVVGYNGCTAEPRDGVLILSGYNGGADAFEIPEDSDARIATYRYRDGSFEVTGITLTPQSPTVSKGRSLLFSAEVSVTGVSLSLNTLDLLEEDIVTLVVTITPGDATNQGVTWGSSDTDVATVDSSGTVTAVGAGTATITVTTDDGSFTDTCAVTVTDSAPLVTTYTVTVIYGTGSGQYEEGDTVNITANQAYEGQWFGGWYTEDEVVFGDYEEESTSFTMPARDVTVKATFGGNIPPIAEMISVTSITEDGATLTGQVVYDGGDNVRDRGFVISLSSNLEDEIYDEIDCGSGVGEFTETITGLPTNAIFYVWAFGYNEFGYGYSEPFSFTTGEDQPGQGDITHTVTFNSNGGSGTMTPQTFTEGVSQALKPNTFILAGSIFMGWAEFSEGNIVYSNGQNISVIEDITLYAIWETEPYGIFVTTENVDNITSAGARFKGRIATQGGAVIDERGFVYGMSPNPKIGAAGATKLIASGNGSGNFTASVSGLGQGKTYYVRAYALAQDGEIVEYGRDKTFTTRKEGGGSSGGTSLTPGSGDMSTQPRPTVPEEVKTPSAGEVGYLDIPEDLLALGSGNVILFTDSMGGTDILGLGIVEGERMKYISRGAGNYKIIYNARPFDDIADHWAKDDIDFSSARLLFHGVTPSLFAPETAMTRGMFVTVIGRMYGVDTGKYIGVRFTDVAQDLYYAPFIQWAAEEEIVFGVSENSFEPERPVTRQEMAAIMQRFMDFLGINLTDTFNTFADDEQISDWARENVYMMRGTGIMSGRSNNKFAPHADSTRAEVAVVFKRLIEHIVNNGK